MVGKGFGSALASLCQGGCASNHTQLINKQTVDEESNGKPPHKNALPYKILRGLSVGSAKHRIEWAIKLGQKPMMPCQGSVGTGQYK